MLEVFIKPILLSILAVVPILFADSRPNILWLTFEDTSAYEFGCYGNSDVKTPNVDALAVSGARMAGLFATTSITASVPLIFFWIRKISSKPSENQNKDVGSGIVFTNATPKFSDCEFNGKISSLNVT